MKNWLMNTVAQTLILLLSIGIVYLLLRLVCLEF